MSGRTGTSSRPHTSLMSLSRPQVSKQHRLNIRSPKFIWAPVYSCTHWLRPRNFPCVWAYIRGQQRQTTSLCNPLVNRYVPLFKFRVCQSSRFQGLPVSHRFQSLPVSHRFQEVWLSPTGFRVCLSPTGFKVCLSPTGFKVCRSPTGFKVRLSQVSKCACLPRFLGSPLSFTGFLKCMSLTGFWVCQGFLQ